MHEQTPLHRLSDEELVKLAHEGDILISRILVEILRTQAETSIMLADLKDQVEKLIEAVHGLGS
jgi:hypothetical protein